jgi:hypothetical protein
VSRFLEMEDNRVARRHKAYWKWYVSDGTGRDKAAQIKSRAFNSGCFTNVRQRASRYVLVFHKPSPLVILTLKGREC